MTDLLSNLQIGKNLGSGYYGKVFLAVDDVHGEVAAKEFRQKPNESATDWQTRKDSLLREGQHLKQATHVNVVQVHYLVASSSDDSVYLVMEYCRGGSLQTSFDDGPVSLVTVRQIATDVTLGLAAIHARGMLHRDIKPANILLDANARAKLGDFGWVTDNILFGYASAAGYLDHLAPEIWHGSGTSARSDIWALGMTLYRLLHGKEWYSRRPEPKILIPKGGFADTLKWLPHIFLSHGAA